MAYGFVYMGFCIMAAVARVLIKVSSWFVLDLPNSIADLCSDRSDVEASINKYVPYPYIYIYINIYIYIYIHIKYAHIHIHIAYKY